MDGFLNFFEGFGIDGKYVLLIIGVFVAIVAFMIMDVELDESFGYIFATAPIWLPVTTFYLFFEAWLYYVRLEYDLKQGRVTLEIRLPQDILKSPEAMEMILNQMYQTASPDNHVQTYYDGKNPPKFGLEIVSRGGDLKFYVNTVRKKFKNLVETQMYAQYPGVEVHELDIDYAAEIPWDTDKYGYFSIHYGLKKADAYPIKTYIDFGLDKMPDEDEKIDPITVVLEQLGSIGKGEFAWVQILIDANREVTFKEGALLKIPDWKADAKNQIKKIIEEAAKRVGVKEDEIGKNVNQFLSDSEKDTIKAIERTLGKSGFNTNIRVLYVAEKDKFVGDRLGHFITMWKAYEDINRNAIGYKWRTDFDWNWWQDPYGKRALDLKRIELDEYKRRYFTPRNPRDFATVLTTEELATIFHFPGKVATTPSLGRIPSKRSEAPANLPVS